MADSLKELNCKYILNYENTLTAKNAKIYAEGEKEFFLQFLRYSSASSAVVRQ
jgi:hypothetical protein